MNITITITNPTVNVLAALAGAHAADNAKMMESLDKASTALDVLLDEIARTKAQPETAPVQDDGLTAEQVTAAQYDPVQDAPIINEPKVSKKRVLIAGLLPQQAGMIQSEFGEVFDLAFWKDESLQALKHRAEAAQVTITFTSKIGHAAESAIKATSTEYHRCVGGMTSLRDMLTRMYVENDQTAH